MKIRPLAILEQTETENPETKENKPMNYYKISEDELKRLLEVEKCLDALFFKSKNWNGFEEIYEQEFAVTSKDLEEYDLIESEHLEQNKTENLTDELEMKLTLARGKGRELVETWLKEKENFEYQALF